ncbi:UDP-N-acetylglucosamine--N-acetylmuramyl-(pentapeptide) pyrophosphoryl-undecaprenol N-acetylglucosamine transferase [Acrocarpospora sp. B8E8]|uniref:UDP-N-acetylglucosamine--N-acetylmuramyl- (pentapeptide) pyrophosphoryl-undecaprenol N-acetylglucosamine transferase n=1 Tax=Acrocarpospora sp. B8E8 TaxID=3153572 RepID=UPI00325CF5C9
MSRDALSGPPPRADRPLRLIVTGGGTGGHTYPALTVVRTLQARLAAEGQELTVIWVGTHGGLEARVAVEQRIPFAAVATGKIRRSANPLKLVSPSNIKDMGRVPLGVAQARRIIAGFGPDVVLATGGYVAIPVGLAAKMCGRPLVVHEQTVRLGLANRILARAATTMAVSAPSTLDLIPESVTARGAVVVTGNPVRPELLTGQPSRALEALGLHAFDLSLPTVYVTGGAQGSQQINTLVQAVLPWLLAHANVIHQAGTATLDETRQRAATLPPELAARYHLTAFVGAELPDVLALADVLISRSGAGTIAEVTALGKAAVFIPLANSAGGEQAHNARHLAAVGAAVALLDEATPDALREAVAPLLADPALRAQIADRARAQGRPDAAERLADVVLSAAGR